VPGDHGGQVTTRIRHRGQSLGDSRLSHRRQASALLHSGGPQQGSQRSRTTPSVLRERQLGVDVQQPPEPVRYKLVEDVGWYRQQLD
jgi:hypothetical protein